MDKDGILTEKPRKNLIILTQAAGKIPGGRQTDDPGHPIIDPILERHGPQPDQEFILSEANAFIIQDGETFWVTIPSNHMEG